MKKFKEWNGRYGYEGDWDRKCICGHPLGTHSAANQTSKRPCFNEDTGNGYGTGTECDCKNFKLFKS